MTRERRLAILMWEEIKDYIKENDLKGVRTTLAEIFNYKCNFMKKHNVDWINGCYLCNYIKPLEEDYEIKCQKCPLYKSSNYFIKNKEKGCIDFYLLSNQAFGVKKKFLKSENEIKKEIRLQACENIINILRGKNMATSFNIMRTFKEWFKKNKTYSISFNVDCENGNAVIDIEPFALKCFTAGSLSSKEKIEMLQNNLDEYKKLYEESKADYTKALEESYENAVAMKSELDYVVSLLKDVINNNEYCRQRVNDYLDGKAEIHNDS